MKIIVFGASGSIGRQVVGQAIEQGHDVTAFTRDASRVGGSNPNVRVVEGDVLDRAAVTSAIAGHDAVLVSLGAGRKGGLRAPGTKVIIDAMHATGVRRLICQSTLGAGDSRGNLDFFWKYLMFGALLRGAYADHQEQELHVRQSDLDWTIVRPGAFTDGDRTGHYRHGFAGDDRTTQLRISRADVADFMLRLLHEESYLRGTPALSY